ncbi:hypothetical protein [Luteimonas sp. e5]
MPPLRLVTLQEARDVLAAESHLACQLERDATAGDYRVLLREGDLELDSLMLDFPIPLLDGKPALGDIDDGRGIVALVVTGNLRVKHWIANHDVDGALTLQVHGDVHAGHVLVGGQELRVGGDLIVDGLCWGDYNHGDLTVCGAMRATTTAFTDEYHVHVQGAIDVLHPLNTTGISDTDLRAPAVRAQLPADGYEESQEGDSDELYLQRDSLLRRLAQGRPILGVDLVPPPAAEPAAPFLFGEGAFAAATLAPLSTLPFVPVEANEDGVRIAQFRADDTVVSVLCYGPQAESGEQDTILLQPEGARHWVFCSNPGRARRGLLGKLFGRTPPEAVFTVEYKPPGSEDWISFDDSAPAQIVADAREAFAWALHAISEYAHLRACLTPQDIEALLALPIAQPYDDWWDMDRNGFWLAEMHFSFRQDNARHDGKTWRPLLQLCVETTEDVYDTYRWHLVDDEAGKREVELWYSPDNNNDDIEHIMVTRHLHHLRSARSRLLRGNDLLRRAQVRLQQGIVPPYLDEDDAFAIRAWHDMGYPVKLPDT